MNDLLIKSGHFLIGEFAQSKNHILWRQTFIGLGINLPPLALHRWNRFGGAVLILGYPCGHDRQTSRSYHTADDVYVGRSGIKASYKHWNCERVFRLQEREGEREGYVNEPHVIVARDNESIHILVEIFDWQVWPDRQRYYYLEWDGNAVQYLPIHRHNAWMFFIENLMEVATMGLHFRILTLLQKSLTSTPLCWLLLTPDFASFVKRS